MAVLLLRVFISSSVLFLQIHLVFMLCSLLKTSKLASSMSFLIIFIFGFLSLAVLIEEVPDPLKWFLGLLCPFAFNTGIAKVRGRHSCRWRKAQKFLLFAQKSSCETSWRFSFLSTACLKPQ